MSERLYLDYAASAPLREAALRAERAYYESDYAGANPNSLHTRGRMAQAALESARNKIVRLVGGGFRSSDLIFTSGGTESNNLALFGISEAVRQKDQRRNRVLISAIEHDSILDLVQPLKQRGFHVDLIRPNRDGLIEPSELERVIDSDVALVSVMYANNETGIIQDVDSLAKVAHSAGALFHSDCVQALGKVQLHVEHCDAVSICAHKMGGPVGIGALLKRRTVKVAPQSFGGGQESGLRAGTQDVCAAQSFAATLSDVLSQQESNEALVAKRTMALYEGLCKDTAQIMPTVSLDANVKRLPGMVSVMIPSIDSETLILHLDEMGFEVSAGSACSSASLEPSHVLKSMGIARDLAFTSLRISFDERVSDSDLKRFEEALVSFVSTYRR